MGIKGSRSRGSHHSEDGFTLVELMVYALLLMLVLAVVGGIVISTQAVGTQVRESTQATTEAQLAADSVATSIRNSSAFEVTDLVVGDQLLLARTASRSDPITWHCTAWYFSAADQTLRYTRSDVAIPMPASAADVVDWTLLTGGMVPTAPATGIFTRTDSQLEIAFEGRSPDSSAVTIDSSAVARAGVWETAPCF